MCGRYVSPDDLAIEREFNLVRSEWSVPASYNVAPTQRVPIVRSVDGRREGSLMRWGLIPFFAKGAPQKYSTINARIETVEAAASYRGPWSKGQRCLQVANGFYEWHLDETQRKAPFYIQLNNQPVFAFAALWDRSKKPDGTVVDSCVHVTMPANDLMRGIHNTGNNPHRTPAILCKNDLEAWLIGTVDDARSVLRQYDSALIDAYEVSSRVHKPDYNEPSLLMPLTQPEYPAKENSPWQQEELF